ncbi:hypothetical protein TNCV_421381 [Trichonephila clavipes]|nr:hypothetical protein TNCV_421381 [Trichonephila clavipes]
MKDNTTDRRMVSTYCFVVKDVWRMTRDDLLSYEVASHTIIPGVVAVCLCKTKAIAPSDMEKMVICFKSKARFIVEQYAMVTMMIGCNATPEDSASQRQTP